MAQNKNHTRKEAGGLKGLGKGGQKSVLDQRLQRGKTDFVKQASFSLKSIPEQKLFCL